MDKLESTMEQLPTVSRFRILYIVGGLLVMAFSLQLYYYSQRTATALGEECARQPLNCTQSEAELRQKELGFLVLEDADVQPHPSAKGALLLRATLSNIANKAIYPPELVVRFFNLAGQTVALRSFSASQYLRDKSVARRNIPSGATLDVRLELVDPDLPVLSFKLDVK